MPGTVISVFGESDDFQAAFEESGHAEFLITGVGRFRARMVRVVLHRMRLRAVEEQLSRIAFLSLAPGTVRVLLPSRGGVPLLCAGQRIEADQIVTQTGVVGAHELLAGPGQWRDLLLPEAFLNGYARALTGRPLGLPPGVAAWQAVSASRPRLAELHAAAIRVARLNPDVAAAAEAARGLEQELVEALIECLFYARTAHRPDGAEQHYRVMARFEEAIRACPDRAVPIGQICETIGAAKRTLLAACQASLGVGPSRYMRLRRLQQVRRALRLAEPGSSTVSDVARRYGFRDMGRFALGYHELFGESPSVTVRTRDG